MHPFKDKTAIVTGGASGIGFALATQLIQSGAVVLIADIHNASEAAERLGCEGVTLDVRDADAVAAVIRDFHASHGRLDYLFNNAGIFRLGEARHMDVEDWNRMIDVNVRGVTHGVCAAYPLMIEQGSGHIVNTASIVGLVPMPGAVPYVTSKHAVLGMSLALRAEAQQHGVRVTAICPGFIKTPMADTSNVMDHLDGEGALGMVDRYFGWMTPEDLADAALQGVLQNRPVVTAPRSARVLARLIRTSERVQEVFGTFIAARLSRLS